VAGRPQQPPERWRDVHSSHLTATSFCPHVHAQTKVRLRAAGIDENLAHHVAHLFTRDPLVIFDGKVELDDQTTTDHFENIQSTNWQTCRCVSPREPPPEDLHCFHQRALTRFPASTLAMALALRPKRPPVHR